MRKTIPFHGAWGRGLAVVVGLAAILAPLAALRAAEDAVALDNVTITLGATTYRIPRLEAKGASLSAAELAELFAGDEKSVDARLARFSAESLAFSAIAAESRAGATTARASYRDVTAEGIVAGRIAVLRVGGAENTVEKPDGGTERYVWGASVARGVDLRQLVHMALAERGDPTEAMKPLVDEESVETLAVEDGQQKISVKTGRIAVTGVRGRALPAPPTKLLERVAKFDSEKPENDPTLARDIVDAAGALDVASLDVRDVVATGKGEPADKPYRVKIGRIVANRLARATVGSLAVERFSLASSDGGRVSLERLSLADARLASLIEGPFPLLARLEAKGLEADLPDARLDDASRMKFSLAAASADFAQFREVAPTKFAVKIDRLAVDLAARGEAPSTAQFLALGYGALDLSAALAGEWTEKAREAVFAPVRVEGRGMGAATLKAVFGNVSSAVFSPMPLVSRAAALAASVKSVELTLEGGELLDRILAREAKEQKIEPQKVRADYAAAASAAILALGGGGEKAKRIADAASAYVLRPKRLHVRLASEKGVNALDLLAKKPADILESVEVEAVSEK